MESFITSMALYKLECLACGCFSIYLGYRLFVKGFIAPAGDFEASTEKIKFNLKAAAPGTFFSVIGGFVICFTIVKGVHITPIYPTSPVASEISYKEPIFSSESLSKNLTPTDTNKAKIDSALVKLLIAYRKENEELRGRLNHKIKYLRDPHFKIDYGVQK